MFSKSLIATAALCLSLSLQAHAHAAIFPALGVKGTPARSDVQRPSKNAQCGKVNVAQTIDSSQAIQAAGNGTFAASILNFNAGVDGSRQVTALVDVTGTGKSFVSADVLQNGDQNPTSTGTQQLVVQLPAGAACSGGASKNKCLVSFTTAGGFGNCVVVQQGAAAAGAASGAAGTAAASQNQNQGNKAAKAGTAASSTVAAASTSSAAAKQTKTKAKSKVVAAASASVSTSASASAASASASASASAAPTSGNSQQKPTKAQINAELLKELQELEQEFAQAAQARKASLKGRSVRYAKDA